MPTANELFEEALKDKTPEQQQAMKDLKLVIDYAGITIDRWSGISAMWRNRMNDLEPVGYRTQWNWLIPLYAVFVPEIEEVCHTYSPNITFCGDFMHHVKHNAPELSYQALVAGIKHLKMMKEFNQNKKEVLNG